MAVERFVSRGLSYLARYYAGVWAKEEGLMTGVMAGQVAVITGGSAGIGRAAVELFAREGAHVILAARFCKTRRRPR
jgi:NADPH:quinone reductase-like Zn-dependent oxidoreductase